MSAKLPASLLICTVSSRDFIVCPNFVPSKVPNTEFALSPLCCLVIMTMHGELYSLEIKDSSQMDSVKPFIGICRRIKESRLRASKRCYTKTPQRTDRLRRDIKASRPVSANALRYVSEVLRQNAWNSFQDKIRNTGRTRLWRLWGYLRVGSEAALHSYHVRGVKDDQLGPPVVGHDAMASIQSWSCD